MTTIPPNYLSVCAILERSKRYSGPFNPVDPNLAYNVGDVWKTNEGEWVKIVQLGLMNGNMLPHPYWPSLRAIHGHQRARTVFPFELTKKIGNIYIDGEPLQRRLRRRWIQEGVYS